MKKTNKNGSPLENAYIEFKGVVKNQNITSTLEKNYMPYAMSVILSRALPQIDGFKPSHRKLLYTMYNMGLLKAGLTKSANVVGATMKLNPHGDSAIYETMVRLSRGYEALLHPFVESKGNFGKFYSRDMAYAASRYTQVKLAPICKELFLDIEKNCVKFVPNYDNTLKEPALLPVRFPTILVNSNVGIAVSMASSICPFNLKEVCLATIKIIKKEKFNLLNVLKGPDFPGGGFLIEDKKEFEKIFKTGRGSFKVRSKYLIDLKNRCIDITQIPYTTTVEAIIDKIIFLIKENKIKEISDIRDETDLNGLKITIDLKRGVDAKALIKKLFKLTPLQDTYACNFNVLINGTPKVMGIKEIILNWQKFRQDCVKKKLKFTLLKKEKKLHLLEGLNKILLNLDKAIEIVRSTKKEADVLNNLMKGFLIDSTQAEYVLEIRLRNFNKEYILNRVEEKEEILKEIKQLKQILKSEEKINLIICDELKNIIKTYGQKRKTLILNCENEEENTLEQEKNLKFNLFLTKEGYLKKITSKSLRQNSEQKLKQGDKIILEKLVLEDVDLLIFTNKGRMNKINFKNVEETKAAEFGEYLPAIFGFKEGEKILNAVCTKSYKGSLLFFYENGKLLKIALKEYKTNRKKILNGFSTKNKLVAMFLEEKQTNYLLKATNNKAVVFNSSLVEEKKQKLSPGVLVLRLLKNSSLKEVLKLKDLKDYEKFVVEKIPSSGKNFEIQLRLTK